LYFTALLYRSQQLYKSFDNRRQKRDALPWSFSCQVLDVELELEKDMFRYLGRRVCDMEWLVWSYILEQGELDLG
jgi:hypothetical protein